MVASDIKDFLDSFDDKTYDARITKNIRFSDQKCTPDVISFIADCILTTEYATKPFTKTDLWKTTYFKQNTRVVYGKPYGDDPGAKREYDKICGQPLALLSYAHVLNRKKVKRSWQYTIANQEMLEYIASKENRTCTFLYQYFLKILSTNGLERYFNDYRTNWQVDTAEAHANLYSSFRTFVKANSKVKRDLEPDRILHKILNIIAFFERIPGSNGKVPEFYDLMYNDFNPRDVGKRKSDTRSKQKTSKRKDDASTKKHVTDYYVKKATDQVRRYQGEICEIFDTNFSESIHVHHIFPRRKFPQIAAYYENLIVLTTTQHLSKAHPRGKTNLIDPHFQYLCLIAKTSSIEKSIASKSDFYDWGKFIEVLSVGLRRDIDSCLTYEEIRTVLTSIYILEG